MARAGGVAWACLALVGCASTAAHVARHLREYSSALRLDVVPPDGAVAIGQPVRLTMRLVNASGPATVTGCIGNSRTYLLQAVPFDAREGRRPTDEWGVVGLDEHPCSAPFHLAPGEATSWQEEWQVQWQDAQE